MVEAEEAFVDSLEPLLKRTENLVKATLSHIMSSSGEDLSLLAKELPVNHMDTLSTMLEKPFVRLSYNECIEILKTAESQEFVHSSIKWGDDLKTEHENHIVKHCGNLPVFVTNFPAKLKPFYMKEDNTGELVEGFDLLAPYGGELCGGSLREDNYHALKERMERLGITEKFAW